MPVSEEIRTPNGAIDESQIAITSLASRYDPRTRDDESPVGLLDAMHGARR